MEPILCCRSCAPRCGAVTAWGKNVLSRPQSASEHLAQVSRALCVRRAVDFPFRTKALQQLEEGLVSTLPIADFSFSKCQIRRHLLQEACCDLSHSLRRSRSLFFIELITIWQHGFARLSFPL